MFKLRQAKKKAAPAAAPKRGKAVAEKKSGSVRPAREAAAKRSVAKRGVDDKKRPPKKLEKPMGKGSATSPRHDLVLRKRSLGPRIDVGVGAQSVEPAKGSEGTIALVAAKAAVEKKATDVVVMDVREVSGLCDEMIVCTARSVTHLNAVADAVEEALRKAGERVIHRDGLAGSDPDWVLLDYGDMMVHVFRPEARESYGLEAYYGQARLIARWKND